MTRARRAASARPRPDRTRASRSVRSSAVSTSDVDGIRHHMIYNSLVQATRLRATLSARDPFPVLQRDPDEWETGDEPMTDAQRSYLETLCGETGEEFDG